MWVGMPHHAGMARRIHTRGQIRLTVEQRYTLRRVDSGEFSPGYISKMKPCVEKHLATLQTYGFVLAVYGKGEHVITYRLTGTGRRAIE